MAEDHAPLRTSEELTDRRKSEFLAQPAATSADLLGVM